MANLTGMQEPQYSLFYNFSISSIAQGSVLEEGLFVVLHFHDDVFARFLQIQ